MQLYREPGDDETRQWAGPAGRRAHLWVGPLPPGATDTQSLVSAVVYVRVLVFDVTLQASMSSFDVIRVVHGCLIDQPSSHPSI